MHLHAIQYMGPRKAGNRKIAVPVREVSLHAFPALGLPAVRHCIIPHMREQFHHFGYSAQGSRNYCQYISYDFFKVNSEFIRKLSISILKPLYRHVANFIYSKTMLKKKRIFFYLLLT